MLGIMQEIIALAISRTRTRLKHVTTGSHEGLRKFVAGLLSPVGIDCVVAPETVDNPRKLAFVISSWPPVGELRESVISELARAGVETGRWKGNGLDSARDKVDGHCAETAFYLTRIAVRQLRAKKRKRQRRLMCKTAHNEALQLLSEGSPADAVRELFMISSEDVNPWKELMPEAMAPTAVRVEDVIYGGEGLSLHMVRLAQQAVDDEAIYATPIYIMLYEFDGDELGDDDILAPNESAQYGIHAAGLVIDGAARTAYVCDPNGGIYTDGNYEFLSIPIERRGSGTTCVTSSQG
jgi:hypothetical protein